MNRKKVATLMVSLGLLSVVGVGATLAYFTDNAEQENIITMGHVDIDLTEESNGEEGKEGTPIENGLSFENIMPGDVVSKIPTITVDGNSQSAYVRMNMIISAGDSSITQEDISELENTLRAEITNGTGWYYSAEDEYYYYNTALQAGEGIEFFDTVTIPATWENNTADQGFTITLQAEAIQEENVTVETDGTFITGWPDSEIYQYTES